MNVREGLALGDDMRCLGSTGRDTVLPEKNPVITAMKVPLRKLCFSWSGENALFFATKSRFDGRYGACGLVVSMYRLVASSWTLLSNESGSVKRRHGTLILLRSPI